MNMHDELALANKLTALGEPGHLFDGLTSHEERREKARAMVKRCADVTFTIRDGRRVTMAQMFRETYRVDL
jgi:hypothetical protein